MIQCIVEGGCDGCSLFPNGFKLLVVDPMRDFEGRNMGEGL
jgi:hypothetical protein